MSSETKTPSIPAITPSNLTEFARAVKGILDVREGRVGNKLDANVTFRDLVAAGIAQVATGSLSAGGAPVAPAGPVAPGGYDPAADMTIPPKASGLTADGAFSTIFLRWDVPAYANHAYTEVWASNEDRIGGAILIGTSTMSMYVDAVGELGFERYYWIRHVSAANQTGAYNATAGTYAKTATSTESLRQVLAGQIGESELSQSLGTRINLIDAPASTQGSVAYKIGLESAARAEAINQEASNRAAALLLESSARTAAINAEASARAAAIAAEANARAQGLSQEAADRSAAIAAEAAARNQAILDEAAARAAAITNSETVLTAAINSETAARNLALANETASRTNAISSEAASRAAAILNEASARESADSALQTQINTIVAASSGDFSQLIAALQEEQTARIDGDTAESTARQTLATQVRGSYTGTDITQLSSGLLFSELQARSTADTALATRASALEATVNSGTDGNLALRARIASEETARASADSALALRATALEATVNSTTDGNSALKARIASEESARVSGDAAISSTVTSLSATVNTKNKTYRQASAPTSGMTTGDVWYDSDDGNKAYRYNGTSWEPTDDTRISQNAAAITAEQNARVSADTAISNSVTSLTATVNTKNKTYRQTAAPTSGMTTGDIWYDSDDGNKAYRYSGTDWIATDDTRIASNTAAILSEQVARANADSALAIQITSLSATVDGNSAAIQQEITARVNADSALQTQINTLTAASSGDFSELIAALQEEQTARTNADSAEAAARQTLAAQMRGSYTGTDIAQVTSGLLHSEAQARANADSAISSTVTTLTATVNTKNKTYRQAAEPTAGMTAGDIWYDSDDSNKPYRYSGTAWVATDDARIAANTAAITAEQTARANADSALATQITTLTATVNGNTASIQQEATSRATADEALQTQINMLSAASSGDFSELLAALQEEQAARTTADDAEAAARQTLATQMRGLYQGNDITQVTSGLIYSEALARSNGDAAIAQSVSSLQATVNSNKSLADAAIASEQSARASADDALSTSITSLTATVNTKNKTYRQAAAPTSGMTAGDVWYDSDDSNKPYRYSGTAWIATEDTRIAANAAAITAEQTARANADTALASRATALEAIVNSATDGNAALKARIASEESARASGDSAISTTVTSLTATVNTKTKTYLQAAAPTSGMTAGDIWYDSDDGNKPYRYSGTAWVQVDDTRIAANAAAITAEQTARANADTAISNTVATLTATVNTKNKTYLQAAAPTSGMTAGDIWYDSDDSNKPYRYSGTAWVATEDTRIAANTAAITAEQTARANADSALATQINTLTASVSGNTAAIQQEATARASETGSLFAKYTVKVDVAGHVSGFGLASTANNAAPTSLFMVRADQFAVAPPSVSSSTAPTSNLYKGMVWVDTSVTPNVTRYYTGTGWSTTPQALPFVVQATPTTLNGVSVAPGVYMPAAFFMDGSIGNAKIGNAAIDDAKVASLSAAKLTAGDGTIGGILKSENYVSGSSGWAVFKTGGAEFSGVTVRGTVYAGAGSIGGILLGADHIRSSGFVFGSTGFYLGTDGTAVLGKGMTLDSAGNVTFTGQLNGATGTFSGNLSAAGGTFNGQLDVKSASSGARMEIKNNVIKVFDAGGNLRVKIGDLSA